MALTIPPGVDAEGRRNIIWTPTASLSVAILTGATAVEMTCYLSKGVFGLAAETERGTDERECTKQVFEVLGKDKWTMGDLEYVWEPQATALSPTNKAYDTLKRGTKGFFTLRMGVDSDTALAAAQKVWQWPGTVGPQVPKTPEGNASEKFKITQSVVIDGNITQDAVLLV